MCNRRVSNGRGATGPRLGVSRVIAIVRDLSYQEELVVELIGQHEAIERLALATVSYLSGEGSRVLLRGPAESGKTALVRRLAGMLDVPFVEIDASQLAETNWQGVDLSDHLQQLRGALAR